MPNSIRAACIVALAITAATFLMSCSKKESKSTETECAKDSDLEVKGTFTHQKDPILKVTPGSYDAEGTVTNTGEKNAPIVEVTVTFVGGNVYKTTGPKTEDFEKKFDPEAVLAKGTETFKNIRPGQTRNFKIIIPSGPNQGLQSERTDGYEGKIVFASNATFDAHVKSGDEK